MSAEREGLRERLREHAMYLSQMPEWRDAQEIATDIMSALALLDSEPEPIRCKGKVFEPGEPMQTESECPSCGAEFTVYTEVGGVVGIVTEPEPDARYVVVADDGRILSTYLHDDHTEASKLCTLWVNTGPGWGKRPLRIFAVGPVPRVEPVRWRPTIPDELLEDEPVGRAPESEEGGDD